MGAASRLGGSADAELLLAEVRSLLVDLGVGGGVPVEQHSDLRRDLGLDSLALAELLDRVEMRFSVHLPNDVLAAPTVADWLRTLEATRARAGTGSGATARGSLPATHAAGSSPAIGEGAFPSGAASLAAAMRFHAERHGERTCVRLLEGPGADVMVERTFHQLATEADEVGRRLRTAGLGPGERVGIMLPTGIDYLRVLLGALLAGAVPVPLYPPARATEIEDHLRRQARLLERAGAALLVADPRAAGVGRLVSGLVPTIRGVRTPTELDQLAPSDEPLSAPGADELALIQFTSGSTGDPKGVMLTNDQLLANIRAMGTAAEVTSEDVFVSWLPLYHDMGLIGAVLAPLYFGFPLVVMSPLTFLARPATWLEAFDRHRGTLSAAPNAAYQACVDRIGNDVLDGLDLSSWRLAFNGSEQVSIRAVEAFTSRFARCGFRREAMCPAYGLAEVGVGIAFSPLGRPPRVEWVARRPLAERGVAETRPPGDPDATAIVSCGRPLPGYEVRVADRFGRELPDRQEGALSCRGPSATRGYYGNESATASLWRHGWLQTGDLGFVADGEIFLTGRAKDLIIRAGRNLHPEDLEPAVWALEGVAPRGAVVLARPDPRLGTERLVVVAETDASGADERAQLISSIRRRCVEVAGEPPDDVVLVPPSSLLRTASGKLRRGATLVALEQGTLGRRPASLPVQLAHLARDSLLARARRLAPLAGELPYACYAWLASLAAAAFAHLALAVVPSRRARWRLARATLRCLRRALRIEVVVDGSLPEQGAAVIVANHASFLDGAVLLLTLTEPVVLVASTDLERAPLVGTFLRHLGCAFVERGDPERGRASVDALVRIASNGGRIALFPEGGITRAPGLRPFRLGAFAVAARGGCPVVPVGIIGTRRLLRPGTYLPRRTTVRVVVGPPIDPGSSSFASQLELRDAARAAIVRLSGEPEVAT